MTEKKPTAEEIAEYRRQNSEKAKRHFEKMKLLPLPTLEEVQAQQRRNSKDPEPSKDAHKK